MGAKTGSVWILLAALWAGPALAQDDGGWIAKGSPGALPPANPDDGSGLAPPRSPDQPPPPAIPMPNIPAAPAVAGKPGVPGLPGVPGAPGLPGVAGVPGVTARPAAPCPTDPPVVQVLNNNQNEWNGFSGGIGLMVLKPYVSNNAAFTATRAGFVSGTPTFDYDPQPAVQFWLAFDDPSGWGGRLRTFVFDADSNDLGAVLGGAGTVLTPPVGGPLVPGGPGFGGPSPVLIGAGLGADLFDFRSDLRIAATDLEGTYGYMGDDCSIQGSLGLRCMYLRQRYHAVLVNPGDGVTSIVQTLRVTREFEGCGPTAAVFARQRVGCLPVAVYLGLRGALVYGEMDTTVRFGQAATGGVAAPLAFAGSRSRSDLTIPVTELEFGAEYGAMAGSVGFFVRAGVVSQTYWDAGSATGAGGNLSLIGGQIAVGLAY